MSTTMASDLAREALEPFAKEAANYDFGDGSGPDTHGSPDAMDLYGMMTDITVGDLRRARTAYDAIGSGVKALEWNEPSTGPDEYKIVARLGAFEGRYEIDPPFSKGEKFRVTRSWEINPFAWALTPDEAKAAAQADFERRVLSCLSTHTAAGAGPVGEAVADPAHLVAIKALTDAGNRLSLCAQTSGGTAGRDEGLFAAINGWSDALAKSRDMNRIARFEPLAARSIEARPLVAENRWHLGAMNDGLFIIDKAPGLTTDAGPWDREDGPEMVLNVVALTHDQAKAIVDAHNSAIAAMIAAHPVEEPGEVGRLIEETGSSSIDDLRDMALVGHSLMNAIHHATRDGPFKDWTPAEDPAEIVADLVNALAETRESLERREGALETIAGGHVGDQWSTDREVIGMLQQTARAALTGDAQKAKAPAGDA